MTNEQPVVGALPQRGLSRASMITGIGGAALGIFYGLGILPSVIALVTGYRARRRQPYARSLWLAGLICGWVGLVFSIGWIIGITIYLVSLASSGSFNIQGTG